MTIPCEDWLTSDDPERWAAAMVRCQAGPYCGQDGRCHLDGACFEARPSELLRQAAALLNKAEHATADLRTEIEGGRSAVTRDDPLAQLPDVDPDDPLHVLLDCANAAAHGDKRAAARMRALSRERDPAKQRELAAQIRRYMREDEGA